MQEKRSSYTAGKMHEDWKKQKAVIRNIANYPLVINNLRKIYKKEGHEGPFVAVKCFNLKIR